MIPPKRIMEYMFVSPPPMPNPQAGTDPSEIRVMRYREMTSLARFSWSRSYDPKLERWLAHVTVPVPLLWVKGSHHSGSASQILGGSLGWSG
jgi:hypothetical protein